MIPDYNDTINSILVLITPNGNIYQSILLIIVLIFVLAALIKFLRLFGKDVLKGDNLEVIMAFVLAFLSITGLVHPSLVFPFVLALLAVLSVAILKNRYILESIERRSSNNLSTFIESFNKDEVDKNIEGAKEIIFLGTNLDNVIHSQYYRIEERLKKGSEIKILLIKPNKTLCDIVAKRYYEPTKGETISKDLTTSIERCMNLESISKEAKGKLEIRFLDFLPSFGAIFINPEAYDGIIYLWFYTYKTKNPIKPKMILHSTDDRWYRLFKEEIIALWNNASEYR